jgi:hypothetical protein
VLKRWLKIKYLFQKNLIKKKKKNPTVFSKILVAHLDSRKASVCSHYGAIGHFSFGDSLQKSLGNSRRLDKNRELEI